MFRMICSLLVLFVFQSQHLQDLRRRLLDGERLMTGATVLTVGFLVRSRMAVIVASKATGVVDVPLVIRIRSPSYFEIETLKSTALPVFGLVVCGVWQRMQSSTTRCDPPWAANWSWH